MITDFERKIISEYTDDPKKRDLLCKRVDEGIPLAYLIGEWYFWRYTFKITPDCLIPRPDTERTVETALEYLPKNSRFADLCTGSGCIAISILGERADTSCLAVDISRGALDTARENAVSIGVADRLDLICADLLKLDSLGDEKFELIISNPPYIRTDVIGDYPELAAEPIIALDGGSDGLVFYRRFLDAFSRNLSVGGKFIFEIGYDQGDDLRHLAADHSLSCEIKKDYGGNDRVAVIGL